MKDSSFQEKKKSSTTREDTVIRGFESEESESVALRPAFEIENSAPHHILAVRNYQQITAAKPAACKAAVDIAIQIRWS